MTPASRARDGAERGASRPRHGARKSSRLKPLLRGHACRDTGSGVVPPAQQKAATIAGRRLPPSLCSLFPVPCSLCPARSEEHTSELQSLMRISYAVFCLKKKLTQNKN